MPRNTRQYYDPNTTLEFINAAIAPISNFSPSNIVGSIRETRDYNTFMNSFMNQDNTSFFTREYVKEHPYISTLGNIGGDILTGVALNKGYNTLKNNINSRINKRLFNEAMNNMANISDNRLDRIHNIKDWGGKTMPKGTFLMDGNIKSSGTVIENFNPNDLKYSSAITYDDLSNIIPLTKRDDFSIKDLRYSLILLGTGVTLLNSKVK